MKRTVLASVVLLATFLVPVDATAAPQIELVNPSDYTTTLQLSDKSDSDAAVHLVAWVREVPADPLVEFEIQPPGMNAQTFDGIRVGTTDTWEAFVSLSGYLDGPGFTVRARLYGGQDEVNNTQEIVTVNGSDVPPPPESESVEITVPDNGGPLGFYQPKGKATNAVISVAASAGTRQVRVFYTTSSAGEDPAWQACGFEPIPQGLNTNVRCTLREGDSTTAVTAAAAVANRTPPPADPAAQADETGDAHRVIPYAQVPSTIQVDPETSTANPGTCQVLTARVRDQAGRPIAAGNMDVHAVDPNDQLRFGTIPNTTDAFQPPESGGPHPSRENTHRCSDLAAENQQGDHNRPGVNDEKHIESTAGTDNFGEFVFALRSGEGGGTFATAWLDDDDDDVRDVTEATGGGRIGWGEPPPPPRRELLINPDTASAVQGSCQAITFIAREGGNPLPGVNVDVHISGPDETVLFCDPPNGSTRTPPDSGGHVGDSHSDGTRHTEGQTDPDGNFVVGVTSGSEGSTGVLGWLDSNPDDLLDSGELTAPGEITWRAAGDRTISIDANKKRVDKRDRVKVTGRINGDPNCEDAQAVRLVARRPDGKFRNKGADVTNSQGAYGFTLVVRQTKEYRAIAPQEGPCRKAKSKVITVRVRDR